MRRPRVILAGAIGLLLIGIGLWFATMPYPIDVWWHACFGVSYSDEWPISEAEFATAKRLVKPNLGWREIITRVTVPGPDEIRITTTSGARGSGSLFIIRKANGGWAIAQRLRCLGGMT